MFVVCYSNDDKDTECWIGLYKSDTSYYWLDGNPSWYRNWGGCEPNNNDPCVRLYDGKFHDKPCTWSFRYVCKGIYFF